MHQRFRALTSVLFATLTGAFAFGALAAGQAVKNILPSPQRLSEHVYAWIGPLDGPDKDNQGYRMNLAFVVGSDAVAVLDTGYTREMGEAMLAHIRRITDRPVKYAINTNSQPDRFMGNPAFRQAGATLIANSHSAERMAAQGANFASNIEKILELPGGSIRIPRPPDRLVNKKTRLDLGGISIELDSYGPSHTPASLVVVIAADNIVYAGDVLYSGRLLAVTPESNIKSWISVFDRFRQYGDVTFIPGHGRPGPLRSFDFPTRQYLDLLLTHMDKMVEEGVEAQDAIDSLDQSRFSRLANFDLLAGRNASWAYLEREAAAFE